MAKSYSSNTMIIDIDEVPPVIHTNQYSPSCSFPTSSIPNRATVDYSGAPIAATGAMDNFISSNQQPSHYPKYTAQREGGQLASGRSFRSLSGESVSPYATDNRDCNITDSKNYNMQVSAANNTSRIIHQSGSAALEPGMSRSLFGPQLVGIQTSAMNSKAIKRSHDVHVVGLARGVGSENYVTSDTYQMATTFVGGNEFKNYKGHLQDHDSDTCHYIGLFTSPRGKNWPHPRWISDYEKHINSGITWGPWFYTNNIPKQQCRGVAMYRPYSSDRDRTGADRQDVPWLTQNMEYYTTMPMNVAGQQRPIGFEYKMGLIGMLKMNLNRTDNASGSAAKTNTDRSANFNRFMKILDACIDPPALAMDIGFSNESCNQSEFSWPGCGYRNEYPQYMPDSSVSSVMSSAPQSGTIIRASAGIGSTGFAAPGRVGGSSMRVSGPGGAVAMAAPQYPANYAPRFTHHHHYQHPSTPAASSVLPKQPHMLAAHSTPPQHHHSPRIPVLVPVNPRMPLPQIALVPRHFFGNWSQQQRLRASNAASMSSRSDVGLSSNSGDMNILSAHQQQIMALSDKHAAGSNDGSCTDPIWLQSVGAAATHDAVECSGTMQVNNKFKLLQ